MTLGRKVRHFLYFSCIGVPSDRESYVFQTHGDFRFYGGGGSWIPFHIVVTLRAFISIRMTLGTIQNDLIMQCETCLRHIRNHPTTENYFLRLHFRKLLPENEKNTFFAYCDFTKAITTFLSLETKSLDTYGQSI